jgi:CRISPR-associated protein Csx17
MPEIFEAVHLPGIRLDNLGNYLAALGLMHACSGKWTNLRGLWSEDHFVIAGYGLNPALLGEFLIHDWKPTQYERWWKGSKEISKLRSWEPDLARVKLLDAHIVSKGIANVYNDVLGTGGNVGKRDFSKVAQECAKLTSNPAAQAWLDYTLFSTGHPTLPDLPSTGTWFANANKAFNSGYNTAREGQLSPWSFLLALEGAILLRGGTGRRLSARAARYATFPFVSEAAAPESEGQMEKERSEFWAPIWEKPATILELKALLRRGQARVGIRAARAPIDFAAAAMTSQVQAGLARFERFALRETTSANTYEAISVGTANVKSSGSLNKAIVQIADWADSLPTDKSLFVGAKAPIEKALLGILNGAPPENWRDLLLQIAQTQRRIDQNKNWRKSRAISKLNAALFDRGWPEIRQPEIEITSALASLGPTEYGLRHNIFGLTQVPESHRETFADPRPASVVWHDGDPIRRLADVLERRLIDSTSLEGRGPLEPLSAERRCSAHALNLFAKGETDPAAIVHWLPALSLINWQRKAASDEKPHLPPESPEFLLQGFFRPLFSATPLTLRKGADAIEPDAVRARTIVKMIRAEMWQQAFTLAERAYLSCGIDVMGPPKDLSAKGDRIAACLLIPVPLTLTREVFRRWTIRT